MFNSDNSSAGYTTRESSLAENSIQCILHRPLTFLTMAYIGVALFGIICNTLTLYCLIKKIFLSFMSQSFFFSLTIADIILGVTGFFYNLILLNCRDFPHGKIFCKLISYVNGAAVGISVLSLEAIAVERVLVITRHVRGCNITNKFRRRIVYLIWLISILTHSPWTYVFTTEERRDYSSLGHILATYVVCVEKWPIPEMSYYFYGIVSFGLYYFQTTIVMIFSYATIYKHIRDRRVPGENVFSNTQIAEKTKTKATTMMVTVTLVFVLTWLPIHLTYICHYLHRDSETEFTKFLADSVHYSRFLAFINSNIHPVLYVLTSRSCRNNLVDHILRLEGSSRASTSLSIKRLLIQTSGRRPQCRATISSRPYRNEESAPKSVFKKSFSLDTMDNNVRSVDRCAFLAHRILDQQKQNNNSEREYKFLDTHRYLEIHTQNTESADDAEPNGADLDTGPENN